MQTKAQLDREIDLVYCLLFIPNCFGVIAQQYDWGVEKKIIEEIADKGRGSQVCNRTSRLSLWLHA